MPSSYNPIHYNYYYRLIVCICQIHRSKPDSRPNTFSLFSCLMEGNEATMKKPLQFHKTDDTYEGEENELIKMKQRDRDAILQAQGNRANVVIPPTSSTPIVAASVTSSIPSKSVPVVAVTKRAQPKTEFELNIEKRQNEHPSKKKDIFKAVFDSSSDEEEIDDVQTENRVAANETGTSDESTTIKESAAISRARATIAMILSQSAEEVNILRNTSPPRGLFAGMLRKPNETAPKTEVNKQTVASMETESPSDAPSNSDTYGPSLPSITESTLAKRSSSPKMIFNPKVSKKITKQTIDDEWVEKDSSNSKSTKKDKKHKKEKKKKHKKEKHKDKKKKK